MAKRMRRSSPDDESSDSQSRHAVARQPSRSRSRSSDTSRSPHAQPPLPLKKKRTRTLTTPHQSAVLHNLLAQSRFPTTAMREEVGRAIGLSARKVQIWFQNQRQKARRPGAQQQSQSQTQSGVVASQPYPTHPSLLTPATGAAFTDGQRTYSYSGYAPSEASIEAAQAQLSGPGIAGPSTTTTAPRQRGRPLTGTPAAAEYTRELPPLHSPYSSRSVGVEDAIPFRSRAHDPARTLPPLDFTQPLRRGSEIPSPSPSYLLGGSAPPTPFRASPPASSFHVSPPIGLAPPRSRSPSPQFAHNLPPMTVPGEPYRSLPPPFALQPQPRWPAASPHSATSSASSGWPRSAARTGSRSPPSLPPVASLRSPSPDNETPRLGAVQPAPAPAPSRGGRYDPVRGGFVPSPSPPASG
ncbi:Homeobox-domain-containing protein [Mycena kentingensis (nom. inval.)]|nr:Homeobox-domain-containing protein [Mycena kentingensis (nom. inval.)]